MIGESFVRALGSCLPDSRPPGLSLDPTAGAAALVTRVALAILLICVPVASVATRQAVYVLVPVGAVLMLAAWLMEPTMRGPRELRDALSSTTGLAALFLLGWTALSLTWTPFAVGPSERFVKTVTTACLFGIAIAFLPERTKTSNLYLLPIGAMAGALACVVAALAGWAPPAPPRELSVLGRSALGLVLLLWPGIAGLLIRDKQGQAIALASLSVVGTLAGGTPLAYAALVFSGLTFLVAWRGEVRLPRLLAIVWGAIILLSPLFALAVYALVPAHLIPPVATPMLAWGAMIAKDGLRTLLGHGFDAAARGVAAGYLPFDSPHSFLFEVWFELGIVGAAAFAFVTGRAFLVAGSAPGLMAPCLLAGLVAALVATGFGVGIAPIWWVTLLALDALVFALVWRGQFRGRRPVMRDFAARAPPADAS
jgi:hypothetical protein